MLVHALLRRPWFSVVFASLCLIAPAVGDDPAPAAMTPKLLVKHLDNPCGIAIQPDTGHVFVTGNHAILRYIPSVDGKPHDRFLEVEGFPNDVYGKGPVYNLGPLGLAAWGKDRLIVADGSRKDGEELVRVYKVADTPGKSRQEAEAEFTLGPIPASDQTTGGEGNFYGVVVWKDAIYVTANGDDTKGWIAKSEIKDGKPGPLTLAIATKPAVEVDAPVALTVTPDDTQLVVGQMGEINVPGDSLLCFYGPDGKLVKKFVTSLHDITALAYSPVTKKLYATDFAWADTKQGGLFELTIEGESCTAKKIVELDRPTALAFDKEGRLYITVFGTGVDTGKFPTGGLVRLPKGL